MNHRVNIGNISHSDLPENDYVSPGLAVIMPDRAFPNMIVGDISVPRWPYLRRWVEQNWYTDRRNPDAGFVNRDEASILYNSALLFRGKPCLEVGCWRGWSAVHLALGSGMLDIIDPMLGNPDFAESITASCEAAGVLDKVTFHTGASPGAIHTLAQSSGKRWSLIFIDADHEGDAPRLDAEAAMLYATDTAMVLFHDLASPFVAAGLDAMRNAGWRTMVYQTMQIMGVAWRGNVQPVAHVPDPKVFWTLPRHLSGYEVSGWKASSLPADGAALADMTMEDRRNAAMLRAQAAEDDRAAAQLHRGEVLVRIQAAEATLEAGLAERDAAFAERDTALAHRDQMVIQRDVALAERDTALAQRDQTVIQRDAAWEHRNDALRQRDASIALADATSTGVARLGGQLVELTATIARRDDAETARALATRQEVALHRLVQWVLLRRVLLVLLRRAPNQRIATIRGQAAAMGIAEIITDPFVHWLCRRRTLLGLLRRSAWQGNAAVHGGFQASEHPHVSSDAIDAEATLAGLVAWLDRWFTGSQAPAARTRRPWPALTHYVERLGFSASGTDAWVALLTMECTLPARRNLLGSIVDELSDNPELATLAERVRRTPMFDEAFYRNAAGLDGTVLDAALHYLLVGELLGFSPSAAFDATYYAHRYADVVEAGVNCLLHYDETGRGEGRQPLPANVAQSQAALTLDGRTTAAIAVFEHWLAGGLAQAAGRGKLAVSGLMLNRYFERLGFNPAGAAGWVTLLTTECAPVEQRDLLKAIARSVQNNTDLATLAERVRRSPMFDQAFYRNAAGLDGAVLDAALHYLLVGEPLEFPPSPAFDPHYYLCRNPDISDAGLNCLLHYDAAGRGERRQPLPPSGIHTNPALLDPQRENVIVVVHEASRTGSPILGWNIVRLLAQSYNVYTIRMDDGPLTPEFEAFSVEVHGPFTGTHRHPVDIEFGLRRLFAGRTFKYAIVNSIESRRLVEVCARRSVPTVLLMHEFGSYVRPLDSLQKALDLATEIVFPAPIVARSTTEAHPPLLDRQVQIQPQGMSIIPSSNTAKKLPSSRQMTALLRARAKGAFIVIGAGSVIIRKGVDLFIAIAADVQRLALERPVHFLWIGHGYRPDEDMNYSVYLKEQLERSGLQDHITFMDEVSDLDPVYALAHVFLLTSRLDPLPNVSIDAAYRSIPTICFKDASGTADLMLADPDTATGVVAHLDTDAAAELIGRLSADEPARTRMAEATGQLARTVFDMRRYVARLDALGTATSAYSARTRADADTLQADDSFDQCLFLGLDWPVIGRDEAIAQYLALADSRRRGGPNASTVPLRRPMAGFHPWIWTAAHPSPAGEQVDPLAEFIRRGRPPGPWLLPVLRPTTEAESSSVDGLRALLHAHLDNPDLGKELLASLHVNTSACDLLVTTDDDDKAALLRQALAGYEQGSATIMVVPCDGDHLRPILANLPFACAAYDVVGHIHDDVLATEGNGRNFHWQNLVGGHYGMRDLILDAFSKHADLGVVFPGDPYLAGWEKSRPYAEKLAARLGLDRVMPDVFDFPSGGMFWMRTALLQSLLPLYTGEDGAEHNDAENEETTLQSAFIRIIPNASQAAGLSQAVTHIPGVTL